MEQFSNFRFYYSIQYYFTIVMSFLFPLLGKEAPESFISKAFQQ